MTSYNLSELFEEVADAVPDRIAVVDANRRLTFAELDERATRVAHHLAGAGIGAGDHVGLHLLNGSEYLEGMLGASKLRAVAVNVNYRYVERELEYLYDNADLVAVVFHRRFGPRVGAVAASTETLHHLVVVDDGGGAAVPDGAVDYETALDAASPERDFTGRSSDDLYIAYTGGTTGMPKGVLWTNEDIFFASLGGGDPTQTEGPVTSPDQLAERIPDVGIVQVITPPLMHVSAHWGAFNGLYGGGKVVLPTPGAFDPLEVLRLVDEESANIVLLVGDAMVRPFLDALETNQAEHDLSSLFVIASGGAALSPTAKARVHDLLPDAIVLDGYGSTETGVAGTQARLPGSAERGPLRFARSETITVLDDDLHEVEPGSGAVGRLARTGHIPLGYYKDSDKTAETFVEVDGRRYVLPGDHASVEADGSIVLHGRGSVSINTGGEKVFPEEVESALVDHPAVRDVVVVGVPDQRWGERVCAVVELRPDTEVDLDELQAFGREHLAGYKLPRTLVVVDEIVRSPSGKADYRWARERAEAALA